MSDEEIIIVSASLIVLSQLLKKKVRRKKRKWMTSLFRNRELTSNSDLTSDLQMQTDYGQFQNFCRMSAVDFESLLKMIGPKISKKNTSFREAIPINKRLAVTLKFLATGDSYASLMYFFKISKQIIARIVPEVCTALIEALHDYVKMPSTPEEWLTVAKSYEEQWNFPHCLGSIDGKHCMLQASSNGGTDSFNHKSTFSIVLLGIVDTDYCFLFADAGCQGRNSDGGVFKNTIFYKKLQQKELLLPPEGVLPNRQKEVPYVFVADDAFPLQEHIMKPYSVTQEKGSNKTIFNYRLSRAHGVVENAFGTLSAVFRVLRKPLLLQPENATKVVLACVYLHNYLRKSNASRNIYSPNGTFDYEEEGCLIQGNWRSADDANLNSFMPLKKIGRKHAASCESIRTEFAEYFSTAESVQ